MIMGALSIASKDLQIFIRDRGAVFLLFLLPFVFILGFSFIGQNFTLGGDEGSEIQLIKLDVVNLDNGQASQDFLKALEATNKVEIILGEQTQVDTSIKDSSTKFALFIPDDFSTSLASDQQTTLTFKLHPAHNQTTVMTVERAISRAMREYLMVEYLNRGLKQMAEMQAANPEANETFSEDRILMQVEEQQAQAETRPLIKVIETTPESGEQEDVEIPSLGQVTVVGMTVLFVFLSAQNTALSFFTEKRIGSFRRLMAAPLGNLTLLTGKLLPNFILCLVQVAVILFTGGYLISLLGLEPLDLSSDPLGLVLVVLAMALCSTSLGIFIAALVKTESQAGAISSMALFMAAFLAGSFIPLFLFPEALANMARVVPHYWANQALYGLIFRGLSLAEIWPNIAALLVFSLIFFLVGLWRFKFN
jgi:ABC-2 type transport system permease protein